MADVNAEWARRIERDIGTIQATLVARGESRDRMQKQIEELGERIHRVDGKINKVLWSVAGGTTVTIVVVSAWTLVIQPILAILGTQ